MNIQLDRYAFSVTSTILLGSIIVGLSLYSVLFHVISHFSPVKPTTLFRSFERNCRSPLKYAIPLLLLKFGLTFFNAPSAVISFLDHAFHILFIAVLSWVIIRLVPVAEDVVLRLPLGIIWLVSLCICGGCATLPKVSAIIEETPQNETLQIASAKRLLSPEQSQTIIRRLNEEAGPTDVLKRQIDVLESASGTTLKSGNKVTLLIDGPSTYAAMFQAIADARDHVNLETFIFADDEEGRRLSDLLLQKQASGVQVNIIYDGMGSMHTSEAFFERLRKGGIRVVEFNPMKLLKVEDLTHRDHRKILIIDGKVVITGGVNISGVYVSSLSRDVEGHIPWRDTDVQIEGPAVADYQLLFLETWKEQKGPELPGADYLPQLKNRGKDIVLIIANSPGKQNRQTFIAYVSAMIFADRSIHLTNAYFVPDTQTIDALRDAAKRGVDVKIILPKVTDSELALYAGHYYYSDLLEAGVRIFERRDAVLHAKTGVIDSVWSTVGSSNMDFWSFLLNDEVNAVILSNEFAAKMEQMFDKDIDKSDQVKLNEWNQRPLYPRIRELISHLLQHWL